jgi:pimeloyl-ACP methyl ester carboxylesterase
MRELDLTVTDGRTVHVYDAVPDRPAPDAPVVFWHPGTPQSGLLTGPLERLLVRSGARLIAHDRPGYGSSTPQPGRDVAAVTTDVADIADELGVDRFAVLGASGGGPHALACGALLPDRVSAVACLASPAPFDADGLHWFAGMAASGVAEFRAAADSREAIIRHLSRSDADDLGDFAPADLPVFGGPYGEWLVTSSTAGLAGGYEGAVEDDQAFVSDWGFDPASVRAPVLLAHGGADRFVPSSHARWLAVRCLWAELRITPDDGHISIFLRTDSVVRWLLDQWSPARPSAD